MSKKIKNMAAQGDMIIIRVDSIPKHATKQKRDGKLIITHSETGHHHVIERPGVDMYVDEQDPFTAWLEIHDLKDLPQVAELVHERPYDTHETLELDPGIWEIKRQRERSPEGWARRVLD